MKNLEKITVHLNDERLESDLQRYVDKALEIGATKVKIIPTSDIVVDERVVLKCEVPRCFGYGVCANCPPHCMKPAQLHDYLAKYKWAVFFIKEIPAEVVVRDKATIKERVAAYQNVYKIVTEVESAAFYDGHYLAFGFGAGSCRHTFCGLEEECLALQGKKCRFALRARPSMEAVGIDVYKMATQAGWDIYPIGSNAKPCEMPKGVLAGIVIVQ